MMLYYTHAVEDNRAVGLKIKTKILSIRKTQLRSSIIICNNNNGRVVRVHSSRDT